MSIRKVMMMFALMTGIVCAGHAQEVKNDSTATTKAEELKLVRTSIRRRRRTATCITD